MTEAANTEHDANVALHRDVVRGIVQLLRFLDQHPEGGDLSVILEAAWAGIEDDEARDWVFEYVKDGAPGPEDIAQVRRGDYEDIWTLVNSYLDRFGHPPVAWDRQAVAVLFDPDVSSAELGPRQRFSPLAERP